MQTEVHALATTTGKDGRVLPLERAQWIQYIVTRRYVTQPLTCVMVLEEIWEHNNLEGSRGRTQLAGLGLAPR